MEEIIKAQKVVDAALDGIEAKLAPLFALKLKAASGKLTAIENARLHVTPGMHIISLPPILILTEIHVGVLDSAWCVLCA